MPHYYPPGPVPPSLISYGGLIIDSTAAPWNVVANDATHAAANTTAMASLLATFASQAVTVMFPTGTIYFDKVVGAANRWSIILSGLTMSGPKSFMGQGRGITTLVFQGAGVGGEWDGIIVTNGFRGFTLAHMTLRHGTIANPDSGGQNHLLQLQNGLTSTQSTRDVHIYDVQFEQCYGDQFRILGEAGDTHLVENVLLHHCFFYAQGIGAGARSCVGFQRGFRNIEIAHCYMRGAKNSVLDFEATTAATEDTSNIHDCVFNNIDGRTATCVSLGGSGTTAQQTRSRFARNVVLQGNIGCLSTITSTIEDCYIELDGTNAGNYDFTGAVLLYVGQTNVDLIIRNVTIVRTAASAPGHLVYILPGGTDGANPVNVRIEGGTFIQATAGNCIQVESADRTAIRNATFRIETADPSLLFAVNVRALGLALNQIVVENCSFQSTAAKSKAFLNLDAGDTAGLDIKNVTIVGNQAGNACSTGVIFNANASSGGIIDPAPVLMGNDFDGSTNAWVAASFSVGKVFPVISGNRGGITWQVGTVTPASAVTANQGSRYTWMNGNSTQEFYKSTGTGSSGWSTAITIP